MSGDSAKPQSAKKETSLVYNSWLQRLGTSVVFKSMRIDDPMTSKAPSNNRYVQNANMTSANEIKMVARSEQNESRRCSITHLSHSCSGGMAFRRVLRDARAAPEPVSNFKKQRRPSETTTIRLNKRTGLDQDITPDSCSLLMSDIRTSQ